jgi:hypothetical protein
MDREEAIVQINPNKPNPIEIGDQMELYGRIPIQFA